MAFIGVQVSHGLKRAVEIQSSLEGVSVSKLVRRLLRDHLRCVERGRRAPGDHIDYTPDSGKKQGGGC